MSLGNLLQFNRAPSLISGDEVLQVSVLVTPETTPKENKKTHYRNKLVQQLHQDKQEVLRKATQVRKGRQGYTDQTQKLITRQKGKMRCTPIIMYTCMQSSNYISMQLQKDNILHSYALFQRACAYQCPMVVSPLGHVV